MLNYSKRLDGTNLPRLPLKGNFYLTYRCNNNCRHCWSWLPSNAPEQAEELSLDEIRRIADEARALGTRHWNISGGEPMLRPDFPEIFEYLTYRSASYSLNTNGTLITPEIARLLKRPGIKMIALYGATADVYDKVARRPGAFEEAMRGFALMKEAGAGFIVQVVPMRSNWHQWNQMIEMAKTLSPEWRAGAAWLYLSADRSSRRNSEIIAERLNPRDVVEVNKPDPGFEEWATGSTCGRITPGDDRLFAGCIAGHREFHIDPYGRMSFCGFAKDPALLYPLRSGSVREAWDGFIPSLAETVCGGNEYLEKCGSCENRPDCHWCAVFAYLETGNPAGPIPYLCTVAQEVRRFKGEWEERHRRYFRVAGITIRVESDLAFTETPFSPAISAFAADGPGDDNIIFRHHFEIPRLEGKDLGLELYRKPPWAISQKNGTWIYQGISPIPGEPESRLIAVFTADHTRATIFSRPAEGERLHRDGWSTLSLFPTDQMWLVPILVDREALLIHSAAAIVDGSGLLFVGHSEAGKSTISNMIRDRGTILCDDRNIVRRWKDGWRVHGTWSHGDVAEVSSADAPLRAVLFLNKDTCDAIVPLMDRKEICKRLLPTFVKSMVTAEWWKKAMDIAESLIREVPFYLMNFTREGGIVTELERIALPQPKGFNPKGGRSWMKRELPSGSRGRARSW